MARNIWGGLFPCEMCWWQRYAHIAALVLALRAFLSRGCRPGAQLRLARGAGDPDQRRDRLLSCRRRSPYLRASPSAPRLRPARPADELLKQIMDAPMVRCDEIQWRFLGISMAGWNAILSLSSALVILWLSLKRPRPRA